MRDEAIWLVEVGIAPYQHTGPVGRLLVYRSYGLGGRKHFASGDLSTLIRRYKINRDCPIGVVLDRMEEYPSELTGTLEEKAKIVQWLRVKYPNGV